MRGCQAIVFWLFLIFCVAQTTQAQTTQNDLPLFDKKSNTVSERYVPLNAISPNTLRTFVDVVGIIRNQYVTDVNDEMLFRYAMKGMLTNLDRNAEFLDRQAFDNLQSFTEGTVADVGLEVEFSESDGQWVASAVETGYSAYDTGIRTGDYLHSINDKKLTQSLSQADVEQLLFGIAGTQLEVVFSKKGRFKQTVVLQRTRKQNKRLSVVVNDGIAMVRLPVFTEKTADELMEALVQSNTPIHGVILDVRNNPGGVLSSAMAVASLFVSNVAAINVVEKDKVVQTLTTADYAPLHFLPIIVLQDRYSASAAEVLSAVLKKDNRATILGETSYGKGSIQSIIPIADGQAVKLTTAYYETTAGEKIDGIGITPNLMMDYADPKWLIDTMAIMTGKKLAIGVLIKRPE